ncbi:hypothetical protein [Actinokineospora pegani]|uniref:hypothetical protein n=1 Tax=Actinokineospora pegani TaxID=2654637 RepID=UPI0012EAB520|nr:hypothetical protein [Actinokineospora pegani]
MVIAESFSEHRAKLSGAHSADRSELRGGGQFCNLHGGSAARNAVTAHNPPPVDD